MTDEIHIRFTKSKLVFLWKLEPVIDEYGRHVWRETYITTQAEYEKYLADLQERYKGQSPFVELDE